MTYHALYFNGHSAYQTSFIPSLLSESLVRTDAPLVLKFDAFMKSKDAAWGHLFDEDGTPICSYFKQK